jgi:hypothetical protein
MRASRCASGLGRPRLRGRRTALSRGVTLAVARVLFLTVALVLHLAVALVLHLAVTLGVRLLGLRVLGRVGAVVVTLRLGQRPSAGEHSGRRDAADQQNLRLHVRLSNA